MKVKRRGILLLLAVVLLSSGGICSAGVSEIADCWQRKIEPGELLQGFDEESSEVPESAELIRRGAVIGEVVIRRLDVFDPSLPCEQNWLFRAANHLHPTTRERTIRRRLLFETGDLYDPIKLEESARLLRSQNFFYDAWVVPLRYADNRVDVLVVSRDVWTLGVGAGFDRSGGANTVQFGVRDSNFLGTGRLVEAKYVDDPDRSFSRFRYQDPALWGSRAELRLKVEDRNDGFRHTFDLERPFFSLDTRWSAGGSFASERGRARIYKAGREVRRYIHESDFWEVSGGLSEGFNGRRTLRWIGGFTFREDRFDRINRQPPDLPADRTLAYPWIGFERVVGDFRALRNVDLLGRTEDFNLGLQWSARLGYSSKGLGATSDRMIFESDLAGGRSIGRNQLLLFEVYGFGRYGDGGEENLQTGAEVRYFFRNLGRHQLYAGLKLDAGWNLDSERQLLIGGDTGLRGYPRNFQDGDRTLLFTLEQRFYADRELFGLAHLGAAVFLDAGRAWFEDGSRDDHPWLWDMGMGLRLGSSRSSRGGMLHLDVAFPLSGDERALQWLVRTRDTF